MEVYNFIDKLRNDKVFTAKQLSHIETVYIYMNDLNVYKVILAVYPSELKKAKKCGLKQIYTIFERDFGKLKEPCPGTKSGRYLMLYKPYNQTISCYTGEQVDPKEVRKNMISYRRGRK